MVASAGITLGEATGWFGDLRWRYISSRPLTEDGAFQSPPLSIFNGQIGYRFDNGWRIQLDGSISSMRGPIKRPMRMVRCSRPIVCSPCAFPRTPAALNAVCQNGVMDYVLHPIEPLAVRLTLAATF